MMLRLALTLLLCPLAALGGVPQDLSVSPPSACPGSDVVAGSAVFIPGGAKRENTHLKAQRDS